MDHEQEILQRIAESSGFKKFAAMIEYATYFRQSDYAKSTEYSRKAREFAIENGNLDYEVEALISEAFANLYHQKFAECERAADQIFELGEKMDNPKVKGICYNIKARIATSCCKEAEALEYNLKNLDYLLQKPDPNNLMICYNNIGTCYMQMKEEDKALHYFELAYEIADKSGHQGKYITKFNIACIQYSKGKAQEAFDSYLESAEFFEKQNMQSNLADAYLNMGLSLVNLKKTAEAEEYFHKSAQIKENLHDNLGLCRSYYQIASLLDSFDKFPEAKKYLELAQKIAEKYDYRQEIFWIYKEYDIHWQKQNNYKELSEVRSKLLNLSEQLNRQQHNEKILELETKYETEIYKLKTEELNKSNVILQKQIDKLHDVQKNLQNRLKETSQMLSEQETLLTSQSRNALMGEMISLIAHQWRQPLNIISVLAQSFDEAWEFDEMTPEYTEKQVKLITDQVLYMSDTIEDFRNFFKSQQGQRFNLRDVINKALKLENYMLKQYNIELLVDLEDGIYLTGNPNEIMQVIINLINNARDAMVSADIKKRRISLTMKKVRDKCSISIFNNGTNIPDKIKEKIFEPYFTTRGSAGTGIGLYICQMILKNKYNGSIKAVNHPDGVEFVITVTAS